MTTQIKLTASQVKSFNKKQALDVAKQLEIVGRHDMTKSQLLEAIEIALENQNEPEAQSGQTQVTQAVLVPNGDSYSPTREHLEACLNQKALPPAPKPTKKNKATKKKAKAQPLESLNLPMEVVTEVEGLYKVTADTCSDPGRLVVNRAHLFEILASHWNVSLSPKIINQLVVLASRKLARQPLTINSAGSRFKYVLAETNAGHKFPVCLEILSYLWSRPQLLEVAQGNYKTAAKTGLEFVSK